MNDYDRARDLAVRSMGAVVDDQSRPATGDYAPLERTRFAIDILSDAGLERVKTWVTDLSRRHPLSSPLYAMHREIIEALADDLAQEMTKREAAHIKERKNGQG